MIQNKKVLAIIPARGGSKGIPRKNIRMMAGKPLIAWTFEAAKQSSYLDRIIVSSDDEEILAVAREFGADVPFERPRHLAEDDTPGIAPILHALDKLPEYEVVVLLQPTSPLRTTEDIDGCIEQFLATDAVACVSVAEPAQNPYWMYTLSEDGRMRSLMNPKDFALRRQDLPKVLALNGAVYVAKVEWLKEKQSFLADETVAFEMPYERSVDIDEEADFWMAESLLQRRYPH